MRAQEEEGGRTKEARRAPSMGFRLWYCTFMSNPSARFARACEEVSCEVRSEGAKENALDQFLPCRRFREPCARDHERGSFQS